MSYMSMLGKLIYEKRAEQKMTQDQFGSNYGVSGPAIFKFEKGFVNPSFKLWMRMAADFEIPENTAVLLWAKAKVPSEYQDIIEIKPGKIKESDALYKAGLKKSDFARITNRERLRSAILSDTSLPSGLRNMCKDEEIWSIYKPTGREINQLRDFYGRYGDATKGKFREALRLLREFSGHD